MKHMTLTIILILSAQICISAQTAEPEKIAGDYLSLPAETMWINPEKVRSFLTLRYYEQTQGMLKNLYCIYFDLSKVSKISTKKIFMQKNEAEVKVKITRDSKVSWQYIVHLVKENNDWKIDNITYPKEDS